MKVTAMQGDTIDAVCYRHYGRTEAVTEAVLQANPGLAELGPILPMGTLLDLPDDAPTPQQNQMIQLWD